MKKAIGIFDSGVGGLTVVKEVLKYLPHENILYFGDVARVPYGSKTPEEILQINREILDWMKDFNIKAAAMACNTSSALALDAVRDEYDFPIFGLIQPTSKFVKSIEKKIKKVGIIATAATVKSQAYSKAIKRLSPELEVFEVACPGLVEIIESGQINSRWAYKDVKKFIDPLVRENVDKIILGCTHYPYAGEVIKQITGNDNILINPAEFMVVEMKNRMIDLNLLNAFNPSPSREFYVSASPVQFATVGSKLLPGVLNTSCVKLVATEACQELAVS